MDQKEVQIDNLIDYIKVIFEIPNYSKNFFNLDSLFKIIDEVQYFEEEIKSYHLDDKLDKNGKAKKKKELVEMLKKIIRYYHEFPLIESLVTIYRAKKDEYNMSINGFEKLYNELEFFYRGVYDGLNYNLLPSCFRSINYGKEDKFYHYIKSRCVNELNNRNHLDTLVTLQHYECPTRLLDITSNPLVALYFACKNYGCKDCDKSQYGYVYVFANPKSKLLFKDSDKIIILSCLARFTKSELEDMHDCCVDLILKKGINAAFDYNKLPKVIDKLYHEIMTEVSFEKRILARDLLQNYFVQPDNSNRRIDKQSGAFIISGLSKNQKEIEEKINYNVIYKIKIVNRAAILKELDALNINEASLFPELDKVAKYYTSKI